MSDAKRRFTVCVDFDGVIAEYDGWKGHEHFGDPNFGTKDALEMMKGRNWAIIVYTTRGNAEIAEYMAKHDLQYDWINHNPMVQGNNPGKPIADVYIDDNALRFTGWLDAWFVLKRMEPKGL